MCLLCEQFRNGRVGIDGSSSTCAVGMQCVSHKVYICTCVGATQTTVWKYFVSSYIFVPVELDSFKFLELYISDTGCFTTPHFMSCLCYYQTLRWT